MRLARFLRRLFDGQRWPEGTYPDQLAAFKDAEVIGLRPVILPSIRPLKVTKVDKVERFERRLKESRRA